MTPSFHFANRRVSVCVALVAMMLACAGCSSQKSVADSQQPLAEEMQPTFPEASRYYIANFTVQAMGMNANGQMRMQQDSVIWVSASKIVELGRAKVTPDSVIVYAKLMNACFRGTYEDVYNRFHWRTDFRQLSEMVTAEDAAQQIAQLAARFGITATITLEPWKRVSNTTFPIYVPQYAKPL